LGLSRGASFLYQAVLAQPLHTYTSCFRVYRREAVANLEVREKGFLGIAEILGTLVQQGSKVIEYPATLQVRMFGYSKMKVLRTVAGHLKLLLRFARRRWQGGSNTPRPLPRPYTRARVANRIANMERNIP
jgi:dolichol-phosphate mannosyltransferase